MDTFRLRIAAEPHHLLTVRLFAGYLARYVGLDEETVADVKLATSELAAAAIESQAGPEVTVDIEVSEGALELRVEPLVTTTRVDGIDALDIVSSLFPKMSSIRNQAAFVVPLPREGPDADS